MSFVFLKNMFFHRSEPSKVSPSLWTGKQRMYDEIDTFDFKSWNSAPTLTYQNDDLESQKERSLKSSADNDLIPEPASQDKARQVGTFKVNARVISDAIIGLSDGLTVPFALTAGLSAMGNTRVVVYGGIAELIAGAISMGLGGYLGAKSEQESYKATLAETADLIVTSPSQISSTLHALFTTYQLPADLTSQLTDHLFTSPQLVPFLMRFEHSLSPPESSRAVICALTIALGYFLGGFLPLLPYIFVPQDNVSLGLYLSIGIMVLALFVFGYVKTCFVAGWAGWRKSWMGVKGGLEMVAVGTLAAGAAMGLVIAFSHHTAGETGDVA
ncbi:MAG: hypothetical protein M1818_004288 [Claussenomyces sp. TS43310]|nr:MAG: hypothetical protein M1818_004288 [Claussenomyces sp. TS43310]